MSTHQIHVFISHSWNYSEHYEKLAEWIFQQPWEANGSSLVFIDYSVPRDDPIHFARNSEQLLHAISQKITQSHVVVIPTGMYAQYSTWIKKEINSANNLVKPILAVNPWGQQRSSSVVTNAATRSVGWNSERIVSGIWELYCK
ncbi:MAG: nuclease [Gammaproteobacteria bacterium]|nr:nuclease [Gammaproteobacteria bacterium]